MRRMRNGPVLWLIGWSVWLIAGGGSGHMAARAEDQAQADDDLSPVAPSEASPSLKPSWTSKIPTLGGRQFWGDVAYFRGWRIQKHVMTGHCRLLDKDDYRHASGTLEACRKKLAEIKTAEKLEPMSGKAVILVHGIIRSSKSFPRLRTQLEKEGYSVFGFDYPSTRIEIPQSAAYLKQCVESLEGVEEISFVTHSMGGLIVRAMLDTSDDARFKRMVMIATPNMGAELADEVRDVPLFKFVFGPAGQQLVTDENGIITRLPTPKFDFAIIAGGRGDGVGFNPLIPGDDDGTVTVASTRLPGASDFVLVNGLHSFLMNNSEAVDHAVRFLNTGRLRAEGDPQPIPIPEKPVEANAAQAVE